MCSPSSASMQIVATRHSMADRHPFSEQAQPRASRGSSEPDGVRADGDTCGASARSVLHSVLRVGAGLKAQRLSAGRTYLTALGTSRSRSTSAAAARCLTAGAARAGEEAGSPVRSPSSDLLGPVVQLHDLGVVHQLLARVLRDEALAAVDLHASTVISIAESAAKRLACEDTSVLRWP